jgi:N-acylneuraminate cytidylyltransferase/CMP-N,N'-diacetyllegionaminic acid synthase
VIGGQFVLAVIAARGGSKELPGKNLMLLGRIPLVAHTILAAMRARTLDRILLSTDSPEIAKIGKRYGVEAPFLRPGELATDDVPMAPVLAHAVNWAEKDRGKPIDVVVLLQPTSPFRQAHHIDEGVKLLFDSGADSVVGLCEARHNPYWMWVIQNGEVSRLFPEGGKFTRRQDLPVVYRVNGAFYASRRHVLMQQGQILGEKLRGLIMREEDSIDIDTALDFMLAETVYKSRRSRMQRHYGN